MATANRAQLTYNTPLEQPRLGSLRGSRCQTIGTPAPMCFEMVGTGSTGIVRYWKVLGSPDTSASQYVGADIPVTNVAISAQWPAGSY